MFFAAPIVCEGIQLNIERFEVVPAAPAAPMPPINFGTARTIPIMVLGDHNSGKSMFLQEMMNAMQIKANIQHGYTVTTNTLSIYSSEYKKVSVTLIDSPGFGKTGQMAIAEQAELDVWAAVSAIPGIYVVVTSSLHQLDEITLVQLCTLREFRTCVIYVVHSLPDAEATNIGNIEASFINSGDSRIPIVMVNSHPMGGINGRQMHHRVLLRNKGVTNMKKNTEVCMDIIERALAMDLAIPSGADNISTIISQRRRFMWDGFYRYFLAFTFSDQQSINVDLTFRVMDDAEVQYCTDNANFLNRTFTNPQDPRSSKVRVLEVFGNVSYSSVRLFKSKKWPRAATRVVGIKATRHVDITAQPGVAESYFMSPMIILSIINTRINDNRLFLFIECEPEILAEDIDL
jgi:hypothetical protein